MRGGIGRRVVFAGAVAVLVAGLSACGSEPSGPAPGKADAKVAYTTVEAGHLTVEYPSSWKKIDTTKPWTVGVAGDGMQLQVAGEFSEDQGSFPALARLDLPATLKLAGYTPVETTDITVDGAYDAMYRKYTYTNEGQTYHGIWILASQWPYPAVGVVSISGPKLDDGVVNQVIKTLTFKKYH